MALRKSSEIPPDAVKFQSESEAALYIWDIVYNWKTFSQIWALKYGPIMLGSVNAVCGLLINNHYRNRLKLGVYGQFSSAVPVFAMPAFFTTLFHNYLVPTDMLLTKSKPCPVCYEIKSAVIQCGFGLAYPMVLAPMAALMFANRHGTYRVPDLTEGPKVMFNFLRKHTKPFYGTIMYMAAIQIAASSIITYFEMKNQCALKHEIFEIEKLIDAKYEPKKSLQN